MGLGLGFAVAATAFCEAALIELLTTNIELHIYDSKKAFEIFKLAVFLGCEVGIQYSSEFLGSKMSCRIFVEAWSYGKISNGMKKCCLKMLRRWHENRVRSIDIGTMEIEDLKRLVEATMTMKEQLWPNTPRSRQTPGSTND